MQPDNVDRLILRNEKKDACEGYLEVYHDGSWGYVGDGMWNGNTEEVVCRSTHCGAPNSSKDIVWRERKMVWLNDMTCNGTEKQLWDCDNPGWGVSKFTKDSVKWIQCSGKTRCHLNLHC